MYKVAHKTYKAHKRNTNKCIKGLKHPKGLNLYTFSLTATTQV